MGKKKEPSIGDSDPRDLDDSNLLPPEEILEGTPEHEDPAMRHDRMLLELQRAFLRPKVPHEELEPYRVRVAWRWAREVACLKSLVSEDEMLGDVTIPAAVDPWRDADAGQRPGNRAYYRLRADAVDMVNRPMGVSILPPPVPLTMRASDGRAADDYDPAQDPGLVLWMKAFHRVITYLGVERGSKAEPDQGVNGLRGLSDLETVRVLFPSPARIMLWEEMIVRETWNFMVDGGQLEAGQKLVKAYGLTEEEVSRVVKLARNYGSKVYQTDTEVDRAMICARLEELALRARKAPKDLRVELAALKQLAIVKGVSRTAAEDFVKEAHDAITRVAGAIEQKGSGPVNRLPSDHPG